MVHRMNFSGMYHHCLYAVFPLDKRCVISKRWKDILAQVHTLCRWQCASQQRGKVYSRWNILEILEEKDRVSLIPRNRDEILHVFERVKRSILGSDSEAHHALSFQSIRNCFQKLNWSLALGKLPDTFHLYLFCLASSLKHSCTSQDAGFWCEPLSSDWSVSPLHKKTHTNSAFTLLRVCWSFSYLNHLKRNCHEVSAVNVSSTNNLWHSNDPRWELFLIWPFHESHACNQTVWSKQNAHAHKDLHKKKQIDWMHCCFCCVRPAIHRAQPALKCIAFCLLRSNPEKSLTFALLDVRFLMELV